MRPRQDITEMFSTFIDLQKDEFSGWLVDRRLRVSMQNYLIRSPEVSEKQWALYWYQHWRSPVVAVGAASPRLQFDYLAKMHLQAYLQEPCYQVGKKTKTKWLGNSQYSVADVFQMANAEIETILKDFDSKKSSGLKEYFGMAIRSKLRDIFRQRQEADPCSNWALLRKVRKKQLEKALKNAGLRPTEIPKYLLAWKCFNQIYLPTQPGGTKQLPEPSSQLWKAIADSYNSYRHQLTENTPPLCTTQLIKEWLDETVGFVRNDWFPTVEYLDTSNSGNNARQTLEDIPDFSEDSPIDKIIAAEDLQNQQEQIDQMFGVLSETLQAWDQKSQEIFRLYYQEELTQQQIMEQLQMSQATVSRKLNRGRESLLGALVKWSQNLNISLNPNQIKHMSNALEEWLKNRL
ncbi:MAG: sigma-70 family RNA polymerase sigma factor [Richelia sp. RM2_1_2]|nr:sigma-70 family RNA polymerase sigma factor [Richelia sp. SM1_7_0]NJN10456.1 sigma-70 family RNA polymerase sigma factor [Richelia sp. RM1_1_1]NJO62779.1 sigma-70 family RNA polymerase sigma factor [Richelia sp. RM2_1_2]